MSDYKPITGELREKLAEYEPQETGDAFVARQVGRTGYDAMIAMCDAIDAIHAQLERENAELKAEMDRVLGEQEERRHSIGEATVTVTPRIDWMRMIDELDVFTQLVRGFAEQVGEDE